MAGLSFFSTKECEWNDLQVYVSGVASAKIIEFEVGVKQDKEYLYGAQNLPLSIQSGNKSFPVSLTILKGDADALWDAALAAGGDDITDVIVDISGSFKKKGARNLSTLQATGVQFSESMFKMGQNDKSMKVTLPGMAMSLVKI